MEPGPQDPLTSEIIGGAIEVHRALGPGLFESAYEGCLAVELHDRGMAVTRQVSPPVAFKGRRLDVGDRRGLIINFNTPVLKDGIVRRVL